MLPFLGPHDTADALGSAPLGHHLGQIRLQPGTHLLSVCFFLGEQIRSIDKFRQKSFAASVHSKGPG